MIRKIYQRKTFSKVFDSNILEYFGNIPNRLSGSIYSCAEPWFIIRREASVFFFFFSISRHFLSIFFLLQTEDKLLTLYNRWKAEVKRKCHIMKVWSITTLTNLQVKLMEFCWKKKVFVILAQNLLRIVRSFVIVLNIEFRIYQ